MKWDLSAWINTQNMQPIVDQITPLIWTDINIVNADGVIVASSKKHRIGKYHNAAKMLLESDEDQLIIEHTNDVPGVLHGVNFPICIEGVRVGMIGITGKPSEVQLIAKLVRELLQFHIETARKSQEDSYLQRLRYQFLYEWLLDKNLVISREFEERGAALGIHIFRPWIVGVIGYPEGYYDETGNQMETAQSQIQQRLSQEELQSWIFCAGSEMIVLFQEQQTETVKSRMEELVKALREQTEIPFSAGIGSCITEPEKIGQSLHDARTMNRLSRKNGTVCSAEAYPLEMFLKSIPEEETAEMFWKVFQGYSKEELSQTMEMLHVYAEHNGAISKVAQCLDIHKNTLQYRLNRLAEKTGYIPQHTADMSYLYLLLRIYELGLMKEKR